MNSKYSNQDLINATLEIYNEFKIDQDKGIIKKNTNEIKEKTRPLLLSKEVKNKQKKSKIEKKQKPKTKHFLNYKSPINQKITNKQRLSAYRKKRKQFKKKGTLILNKIIKFENEKYLLLDKIKNSKLKIIKMKRPSL